MSPLMTTNIHLLTNSNIERAFKNAIEWCDQLTLCVAWASANEGNGVTWQLLKDHLPKIELAIIGIHFYQTEPWILYQLHEQNILNIILQSDGTFHPKIYLFEKTKKGKKEFKAIIGSHNLTTSAFSKNIEASIYIEYDVQNHIYKEITGFIQQCKKESVISSLQLLDEYASKCALLRQNIYQLSNYRLNQKENEDESIIISENIDQILNYSWNEYYNMLNNVDRTTNISLFDDYISFEEEIDGEILSILHPDSYLQTAETANRLINKYQQLSNIPLEDRKFYCGTIQFHSEYGNSGYFGSMRGAGQFKHYVNENPTLLDTALDLIPFEGSVPIDIVIQSFVHFTHIDKIGLPIATRLMTLKRPDLFFPINSANKRLMSKLFGISANKLMTDIAHYTEALIKIWNTAWFKSNAPQDEKEYRLWKCRVALLDVVTYEI